MNKNSVIEESFVEDLKQPSRPYLFSKRAVDIFGAIVGLIVFSPILLLCLLLTCEEGQKDQSF